MNWEKSEALPLSNVTTRAAIHGYPIRWMSSRLKYLGILVNQGRDWMVVDNLDPIIAHIKLDFDKWSHLGISTWGRVQAVRMVTLPRFTYVLGMLPLLVPLKTLRSVDAGIRSFVWVSVRPHVAHTKLLAHRSCGGLGLPSVEHYALALQLSHVACMLPGVLDPPQWVAMERALTFCPNDIDIL